MLLSEINAAAELVKKAIGAAKAMHEPDPVVTETLNALQGKIYDTQAKIAELWQENETLKRRLAHSEMLFDAETGAMYRPDDPEKKELFCQRCLQANGKLCNLRRENFWSFCRVCKNKYADNEQQKAHDAHLEKMRAENDRANRAMRERSGLW